MRDCRTILTLGSLSCVSLLFLACLIMPLFSIGRRAARDPMVDIENLLIDYAWTELAETTCFDRLLRKSRYILEINWGYIDISHRLVAFRIRNRDDQDPRPDGGVDKVRSKVIQRDLCLFRTEFTNSSPVEQTFTFKTERKTTSRCDISLQRGFRIGANVDVRVSIPVPGQEGLAAAGLQASGNQVDACRITGGLSGELNVTKTTGQTFEETLTWGVDSQIKVKEGSRTVAALMIREEELTADFQIENVIRATHSAIPVYVKDRKTSRVLELIEIPSDKLADILTEGEGFTRAGEDSAVRCETKGTLRAVYGAEQIIKIDSFKAKTSGTLSIGRKSESIED